MISSLALRGSSSASAVLSVTTQTNRKYQPQSLCAAFHAQCKLSTFLKTKSPATKCYKIPRPCLDWPYFTWGAPLGSYNRGLKCHVFAVHPSGLFCLSLSFGFRQDLPPARSRMAPRPLDVSCTVVFKPLKTLNLASQLNPFCAVIASLSHFLTLSPTLSCSLSPSLTP
jgi:hypothetical protein